MITLNDVKENPEVIEGFSKAIDKALKYVDSHSAEDIANNNIQNLIASNFNNTPAVITIDATIRCTLIFFSLFITNLNPFLAFRKVLPKPCCLNLVIIISFRIIFFSFNRY